MKKHIFYLLLVLALLITSNLFAENKSANPESAFRMSTIEGEVMGKTRNNLSVQYSQDGNRYFEAVLPLGEEIKFSGGYKTYHDVNAGDTIRAEFKEFFKADTDGKEVRTGKAVVAIQLLRSRSGGKLVSRGNR